MNSTWRAPLFLLAALAVCAVSAGCGRSALVKVRCQILKDGVPPEVQPGDSALVVFLPFVEGGGVPDDSYLAKGVASVPWTFEVPGKTGDGIPPGKYRIAVKHLRGARGEDVLEGAFAPDKSPIVREILESQELTIDVGKPEG